MNSRTLRDGCRLQAVAAGLVLAWLVAAGAPALAHTPVLDGFLREWCVGAQSNIDARVEDSGVMLECGVCSGGPLLRACTVGSDCPAGQSCVALGSRTETAIWDNRTDGAVNDLATVVVTEDGNNLYIGAELWVDPDPLSLPLGEVALDFKSGGLSKWHDPFGELAPAGFCSDSTDRACTADVDCYFCTESTEPAPSTRLRACGSGCDPLVPTDVCDISQTCMGLDPTALIDSGVLAGPQVKADLMVVFDFSRWLAQVDGALLFEPGTTILPDSPWDPVTGCEPDFVGDNDWCDFEVFVNPGASGGSGGPPGSTEVAIPWSAIPGGLGPGTDFRFSILIGRGGTSLDEGFKPLGAIEDIVSEPVGLTTTTTTNSCPGMGTVTTQCELADGSADGYYPPSALPFELAPGGRIGRLAVDKAGSSIQLDWTPTCSSGDNDYGVYEGAIGNWYSHEPVVGLCSTGGARTATFEPGGDSTYYLIVPNDGATEGSYGPDGANAERPVAATACATQMLGTCP